MTLLTTSAKYVGRLKRYTRTLVGELNRMVHNLCSHRAATSASNNIIFQDVFTVSDVDRGVSLTDLLYAAML